MSRAVKEQGGTAIEYGLIAALVVVILINIIGYTGSGLSDAICHAEEVLIASPQQCATGESTYDPGSGPSPSQTQDPGGSGYPYMVYDDLEGISLTGGQEYYEFYYQDSALWIREVQCMADTDTCRHDWGMGQLDTWPRAISYICVDGTTGTDSLDNGWLNVCALHGGIAEMYASQYTDAAHVVSGWHLYLAPIEGSTPTPTPTPTPSETSPAYPYMTYGTLTGVSGKETYEFYYQDSAMWIREVACMADTDTCRHDWGMGQLDTWVMVMNYTCVDGTSGTGWLTGGWLPTACSANGGIAEMWSDQYIDAAHAVSSWHLYLAPVG